MKAVIMAGGEGTRLRPLTSQRPKPLVPALNIPIMEHIVLLLKQHGIMDIVVTLHYLADEIEGYFGDGSEWGVNLIYSVEDTPLGTAGSVKQAEAHLRDDTFIIISGDALTDINLDKAIAYHRQKESLASIVLAHVPNPLEFGVVITDDNGRIRRFLEKPSWGEVFSDTVNTGMYILEPSVFDYMEMGKNYDWSQDIFPQILTENKPLFGYVMDGDYWCDVGNLQQYREAQYTVMDRQTRVKIGMEPRETEPAASAFAHPRSTPDIWIGDGCDIDPKATLHPPLLLGRNVRIKGEAVVGPYTVVGDNSIIEENAQIHRAVLWDNVYVGYGTNLSACTVCSHTTIKRNCVIQEGAVIGDRCRIEDDSTIRTQIKLWPDKIIEAGSTVTMSLIWGQKWAGSLFRQQGVMGIANIELTPDFACKLGASFGGYLKRGATVVTSRDSGLVARMLKRAMISGLLSVGVNVLDMRSTALPIVRHGTLGSQASGAVHIRMAPNNPRLALIEFYDGQGVYLSKNAERKVETIFFREDFRRVDAEQVGTLDFAGRSVEQYSEDFSRHLAVEEVQKRHLKVVADFAYGRLGSTYPTLLGRLGCDLIALNAYPDVGKTPKNVGTASGAAAEFGADRPDAARRFGRTLRSRRRAHDPGGRERACDRGQHAARPDVHSHRPDAGARAHRRTRHGPAHDRNAGGTAWRDRDAHENRRPRPDVPLRRAARQTGPGGFCRGRRGWFHLLGISAIVRFDVRVRQAAGTARHYRPARVGTRRPTAHAPCRSRNCSLPLGTQGADHARADPRGRRAAWTKRQARGTH